MQSMEQKRAAYAWERVRGRNKEYKNLAKSLPAMVMTNGLMQTLAFLEGKRSRKEDNKKDPHGELLRDVLGWLKERKHIDKDGFEGAMQSLYEKESGEYRRATEEALEILRWIRQLADAAVKDGD